MSRILISILSDYLQPNFLLIKEMEGKYDELIFITTKDMEDEKKRKSHWLEKALRLPEKSVRCIEVIEDDFEKIKQTLKEENFLMEDSFILNLTGGTKVMPLAVYEFFTQNGYDAKFYYVPNNKTVIKDLSANLEVELGYRLNLEEYFTLNGLRYEPSENIYPEYHSKMLFNEFKQVHFDRRRHKKISDAQNLPKAEDKVYYAGAWFEEYCYYRLKKEYQLEDSCISHGNKIYREKETQNDNEIDVMFIKENQLHIFECKVSMWGNVVDYEKVNEKAKENVKDNLEGFMYKLAAIAKDYGFRPNSYILTLHNLKGSYNDDAMENLKKRQRILGIKDVKDRSDFTKTSPLLEFDSKPVKPVLPQEVAQRIETQLPKVELNIVGKIDLDKISKK